MEYLESVKQGIELLIKLAPLLAIGLSLGKKLLPEYFKDSYFKTVGVTLEEIDDIYDSVTANFENNPYIKSGGEILDLSLKLLKEMGYELDEKDKKKVQTRIKAKMKKDDSLDIEIPFISKEF